MDVNGYPLVSIITPVYNGSQYLEELIESVLNQDYPHIEHIIIDDGSEDHGGTVSILRKYPHLRWWSRGNQGQYATMNEGLLAAQGEIICFVNADDLVSPGAVRIAINYLGEHASLDGVFGITNHIDQRGNDYPYCIPFRLAPLYFYPYFAHISHCSLYLRKKSIQQYSLFFDPSLHYVGDYEWIIRISKTKLRIGMMRQELSKVRVHEDQASRKYRDASVLETRKVLKTQHVNKVNHILLSTINVSLLRLWKVGRMLKNIGIRGTVSHLAKRNSHT